MSRDPDFTTDFLSRHQNKPVFGSDCSCQDGHGGGTGQYQHPSVVFTVTREGDKLLLQPGASPEKSYLLPESASNFFENENRRLTYSFVKDEKEQVTYLVIQLEGRETGRAKKIK